MGGEDFDRRYLANLRKILTERFDEGELRTLCFDLGLTYDTLSGTGQADKAREVVAYFERRESVRELVEGIRERRPDISFSFSLSRGVEIRRKWSILAAFFLLALVVVIGLTQMLDGGPGLSVTQIPGLDGTSTLQPSPGDQSPVTDTPGQSLNIVALWPIETACHPGNTWSAILWVQAEGSNKSYTCYIDGKWAANFSTEGTEIHLTRDSCVPITGTLMVESAGQAQSREFQIPVPACCASED